MDDLIKLLEGSANDVKIGLGGLSHDDLLKLKSAEQNGSKREGVLQAIDNALREADTVRTGGTVAMSYDSGTMQLASVDVPSITATAIAADLDHSDLANIAPADQIDTAGAPQQIVPDVDMSHPAVDNDPRAGTTEAMNRIDFNDPGKSGREVVDDVLRARG